MNEIKGNGFLKYLGLDKLLELIHNAVVMKEEGKSLTSNDLTDTLKGQYDNAYVHSQKEHAPGNAERNVIQKVFANGEELAVQSDSVADRYVSFDFPVDLSEMTDKDKMYMTADEVQTAIQNATGGDIGSVTVEELEYYYNNGVELPKG